MDRRVVALGAFLAIVSLSGCLGLITGETISFESSPAAIAGAGSENSEFMLQNASSDEIERPVTVFGIERTVQLSLHRATYTNIPPDAADVAREDINRSDISEDQLPENESAARNVDGSQLEEGLAVEPTVVTIASIPDAQVAGISVNPLAQLSNQELIERFVGGAAGPGADTGSGLEVGDEQQVDFLGEERTMTVFEGAGSSGGSESSAEGEGTTRFYVVKGAHEGDLVIVIAIKPAAATDEGNAETLVETIENIEHPAEPEGEGE